MIVKVDNQCPSKEHKRLAMYHYSYEKVESYLFGEMEGESLTEMETHLATCERCYGLYLGLRSMGNGLAAAFKGEKAGINCPEDWEIGALVREESSSEESKRISSHIKECTPCMDRSAHYYKSLEMEEAPVAAPAAWKEKAVQALKQETRLKEKESSAFQRFAATSRAFFSSLSPVPAYAVAGVAIVLLILTNLPNQGRVLTVASSEKVNIRDSEIPSTLGFSGAGETREVKNMNILYKGKHIVFEWEPVEGVVGHEFTVRDKLQDKTIHSTSLAQFPKVALNKDLFAQGRLYSWMITGETEAGKYFEYTGDFLLVK